MTTTERPHPRLRASCSQGGWRRRRGEEMEKRDETTAEGERDDGGKGKRDDGGKGKRNDNGAEVRTARGEDDETTRDRGMTGPRPRPRR